MFTLPRRAFKQPSPQDSEEIFDFVLKVSKVKHLRRELVQFTDPMVYHNGIAIDYLKWTTLNNTSKLKEIMKTPDIISQRFKSNISSDPVSSDPTCREELHGFITRARILAELPFSQPKKDDVLELCLHLTI